MIQTTKKNREKTEQHRNRRKPVPRSPKLPPTPLNGTNQWRRGRSSLASSHQTTMPPANRRRRAKEESLVAGEEATARVVAVVAGAGGDGGGGGDEGGGVGWRGGGEGGRSAARPLLLSKTARPGRWRGGGARRCGFDYSLVVGYDGHVVGCGRRGKGEEEENEMKDFALLMVGEGLQRFGRGRRAQTTHLLIINTKEHTLLELTGSNTPS